MRTLTLSIAQRMMAFAILCLLLTPTCFAARQSRQLPETVALERDMSSCQSSIKSTRERQSRLKSSARGLRKDLENVKKMIKAMRSVEDKMKRIESELNSLSKVPQLRMLKSISKGVKKLRGQFSKVRAKADNFQRNFVSPNIGRLKKLESQVAKTVTKLRGLESQTSQARRQVTQLRRFVESRIRQANVVAAMERLARSSRNELLPIKSTLADIDRTGGQVESKIKSCSKTAKRLVSLKSGLDKLNRQLAPVDAKAKSLAKALDKKIEFKIPLTRKRIKITVRKIMESPDKIIGVAVKPLTKLAKKILAPLTKKISFNPKPPGELARMSQEIDRLSRINLGLDTAINQLRTASESRNVQQYERAINKVVGTRTSQLR